MSNQDDLFNQNTLTDNTPESEKKPTPSTEELFSEWVGEGKKYSSIDKMALSAVHSQEYIQSLERERDQLREDMSKNTSLDGILNQMTSKNQESTQGTPPETSAIRAEDITSLVKDEVANMFTHDKQQLIADNNRAEVNQALQNKFGDRSLEALQRKSEEVGLTVEQMGKMAETAPKAVLEYFKDVTPSAQRTEGSFNTSTSSISSDIKSGTSKYYSKLRKDNPNLYYSNKIQLEMVTKAKELGSAFYQ